MAPTLPSWWLLFLLLLGVGATAAARGSKKLTPPVSTAYEWPERFHAVVVSINLTSHDRGGGRLQLIELYYDWPHGRDLNIVRDQLSGDPPLYNVEWVNGTSYLFDTAASSCRTFQFPVGLLPPDWIATANYLGRDTVDGFECHVWSNFLFSRYYADVATGHPVRWIFNGNTRHVLEFEAGVVLQDSSKWQAPPYCFASSTPPPI
ncbi:uncharacterized protein At4g14100-like [Oryza glaberrima]|uniref:Uncharacterized protein n=1 Tax=Oryza barthii TaxID=65489 RepID=A0A0D3GVG3_9ORYZ|nr:uncharacterized protein At4g14100-like [Oryza glaberrima]